MKKLSLDAGLPIRETTAGSLLRHAFGIWAQNLVGFSFVSLVVYAPVAAFWLSPRWIPGLYAALYGRNSSLATALAFALTSLVAEISTAAMTYGVIEQLAGRRTSVGAMLAVAARRGPRVLLVALTVFAATMAGFLLLVIPGIYLNLVLVVAVPVAVVERRGPWESMKRSRVLTRDRLGAIFGLFFVVNATMRAVDFVVGEVTGSLVASSPLAAFAVSHAMVAFLLGLPAVAGAVAYHDLRLEKEGTDTAELAKVFE